MRIPNEEHGRHGWWVETYARSSEQGNLELLDLWQYPIEADSDDDFERFLEIHDLEELAKETSVIVRSLFGLRMVLGRLFGWDGEGGIDADFAPVYRDQREQVSRIENATVTALMHLGWVELPNGKWTAQMAVYADPKGRLGRFYMALIAPFRHGLVYPALMRAAKRRWQRRVATAMA